MEKYLKIIIFLFIFSLVISPTIFFLTGWKSYINIFYILIYMVASIYVGAIGAVLLMIKKFKKLSSKQIGFRFFAILFTVTLAIFAGISYYIASTVTIHFKEVTHEQAAMAYFHTGIREIMHIKMFIGTFIGMILAIKTTKIKNETNEINSTR